MDFSPRNLEKRGAGIRQAGLHTVTQQSTSSRALDTLSIPTADVVPCLFQKGVQCQDQPCFSREETWLQATVSTGAVNFVQS